MSLLAEACPVVHVFDAISEVETKLSCGHHHRGVLVVLAVGTVSQTLQLFQGVCRSLMGVSAVDTAVLWHCKFP